MSKPKEIDSPIRISTVLSKRQHRFLEIMTYRLSLAENKKVTISELMRRAVAECYPAPSDSQMHLFE